MIRRDVSSWNYNIINVYDFFNILFILSLEDLQMLSTYQYYSIKEKRSELFNVTTVVGIRVDQTKMY